MNTIQQQPLNETHKAEMIFCAELCEGTYDGVDAKSTEDLDKVLSNYKRDMVFEKREKIVLHSMLLRIEKKLYMIIPTAGQNPRFYSNAMKCFLFSKLFHVIECTKSTKSMIEEYLDQLHNKFIEILQKEHIETITLAGISLAGMQVQVLSLFYGMLIDFYKNYYKKENQSPKSKTLHILAIEFYQWLAARDKSLSAEQMMERDAPLLRKLDIEKIFIFGATSALSQESGALYNDYFYCEEDIARSKSFIVHNEWDMISGAGTEFAPYSFFGDMITLTYSGRFSPKSLFGAFIIIKDKSPTGLIQKHVAYSMHFDEELLLSTSLENQLHAPRMTYSLLINRYHAPGFMLFILTILSETVYAIFLPLIILLQLCGYKYHIYLHQFVISILFYGWAFGLWKKAILYFS